MTQALNIKISGLYIDYNEYSEVPEGALSEATNIDIIQNSVATPRKGFEKYGDSFPTSDVIGTLYEYQGSKLAMATNSAGASHSLYYGSGGAWTSLGSFTSATSTYRYRFTEANSNLYFNSLNGSKKMSTATAVTEAGAPKALNMTGFANASTPAWLANNFTVAYRGLWVQKDANGNLVRGAPSQRLVFTNTSAAAGVAVTVVPPAIYSSTPITWTFQLYRSSQVAAGIEPSDELGLVYEKDVLLSSSSTLTFAVIDTTEDTLRGATLYTSQSQEGLANQNDTLPFSHDMALFRDSLFYANTKSLNRFVLTLTGVGNTDGIAVDDTVAIGGVTYTGKATENATLKQFKVTTSGTALEQTTETAMSLVNVINRTSTAIKAYYLSDQIAPGALLIEPANAGTDTTIYITSSKSTCWVPKNIPTSGTSVSSSPDTFVNGLFWSKSGQPESVPLVNFATVGAKNNAILRVLPLEQALYIFKQNEGLYKLSGYYPNFQIDLVDASVRLVAPETAQIMDNRIYCLTDQGVCIVDDSTSVISRPIESELLNIVRQNPTVTSVRAFAVANESTRKYMLYMPSTTSDKVEMSYVYNSFTNTWTKHDVAARCGYVSADRSYYIGPEDVNHVLKERDTDTDLDYVDFGSTSSIATISDNVITLGSGFDTVEVGDSIYQSATKYGTVTEIDTENSTLTLDTNPGLTVAAADILKAIPTRMTWCAVSFGNPSIQHQYHTATLLFREGFLGTGTMEFKTDTSQLTEVLDLISHYHTEWGMFGWGESPWGEARGNDSVRQWVPRAKQRAISITPTFTNQCAFSGWQLVGMSIFGVDGSEGIGRNNV